MAAHLVGAVSGYYVDHLAGSAPVVVYDVGGELLLADGYHRVAAARHLGRGVISAEVRKGTRADALRFAAELAQRQRGLREEDVIAAIIRRNDSPQRQ